MKKFNVYYKVIKYYDCFTTIEAESIEEAEGLIEADYILTYEDEGMSEYTDFEINDVSKIEE